MPIIGLALVGGAAALLINYLNTPVQPVGKGCTSPTGADGDTQCINQENMVCDNGVWVAGGNGCGSSQKIKGEACSVVGSGHCSSQYSGSNLYYVCESDGFAYSDGTPCTSADIAACNVLNCVQSNYMCGGPNGTDLYQDYVCDPKKGHCNYMQVYPNSSVCAQRTLGSATVFINNQKIDPTTDKLNPYTLYQNNRAVIEVQVTDTTGMALEGVDISITSDTPGWGGFASPSDLADHSMNCSEVTGVSGATGKGTTMWLWTAFGEMNLFGNNTQIITLKVTTTYLTVSLVQYVYLALPNGNFLAGMTSDGVLYGSVCCGAATSFGCSAQSQITMDSS